MRSTLKPDSGVSRRGFVKAVAGGSLVTGFDAVAGAWPNRAHADGGAMPIEDLPALDGALMLDDRARKDYAQDYGQIVHEPPRAVLRPASVRDIAEIVRFARRKGLRVAARGHGHQPFGQAQAREGCVIDMQSMDAVHAISSEQIEVDAGAQWRAVLEASLPRGRTPPVLTAYQSLSVGGTLSIGGIGVATLHHGAQVDHALELQVVTGTGEVVTCSEARSPDLFEAMLAGQGQCGIITRATLRLIAAKPIVREYMLQYSDLSFLLQDAAALSGDDRFDGVVALLLPTPTSWMFTLSLIRQYTPPDAPDDAALTAGLRADAQQVRDVEYGAYLNAPVVFDAAKSHADLGLVIPAEAAPQFLGQTLPRLREDDLGMAGGMRVFFWPRKRFTRPLFRLPDGDTVVYMAMLRAETSDPHLVARQLAGNRTLFEADRALGGTLYPFGALHLSREDWERHYGAAWPGLARAKRRYDPDNVFASGPDIFQA